MVETGDLRKEQALIVLCDALGDTTFYYMVRSLQRDPRIRYAHTVDIVIRKNGLERRIEADWLKKLARYVEDIEPPPL